MSQTQVPVPKAKFAAQRPVAVLDEALRQYIESRNVAKPCKHVLAALQASLAEYDALYMDLAK